MNKKKNPQNHTKNSSPSTEQHKPNKPNNSGSRRRIERLFKTVGLIANANARGGKINVSNLMEELEADRSTVMRDLEFLRDMEIELDYDPVGHTYVMSNGGQYIPAMELGDKDYLLLEFIQQCLAQYSKTELGQEMLGTFKRLFGIFTGNANWNKWSKSVVFRVGQTPARASIELKIFHLLHRAINGKRVVTFSYKSPKNAKPRQKTVEPHLMIMNEGRWYLYGTDAKTRRLTPFAFPRISDLSLTAEKFTTEPPRHPRELLRHSFGCVIGTEAPSDVVVEFEPEVAERIKETVWHPDQTLRDLPGGGLRLSMPLNSTLEVKPWILSWGPYARTTAPTPLAAELSETVARMHSRLADEHAAPRAA